jgi:hypothetical protein
LILSFNPSASRLAVVILACICSPLISAAIVIDTWPGGDRERGGKVSMDGGAGERAMKNRICRSSERPGQVTDANETDDGNDEGGVWHCGSD